MGLFDAFKRRSPEGAPPSVPSPQPTKGEERVSISLQVLLETWRLDDEEMLAKALQGYDPSLRSLRVTQFVRADKGALLATLEWEAQEFKLVAFAHPMPPEAVETCLASAHFNGEIKEQARAHRAHALLFCESPRPLILKNYIRLALLCGGVVRACAGLAVLNETAQTALPASLWSEHTGQSPAQFWGTLPLLYLYGGFVKYLLPDSPQVWMATRGLQTWSLPNLAHLAPDHSHGSATMDIFNNVAAYLVSNGPVLGAGHTMQIGAETFMRLREPQGEDETAIAGGDELLIAEFIGPDEANTHIFPAKGTSN